MDSINVASYSPTSASSPIPVAWLIPQNPPLPHSSDSSYCIFFFFFLVENLEQHIRQLVCQFSLPEEGHPWANKGLGSHLPVYAVILFNTVFLLLLFLYF